MVECGNNKNIMTSINRLTTLYNRTTMNIKVTTNKMFNDVTECQAVMLLETGSNML